MMIELASLDAQLHAVEAGWWHDCPDDVREGLLAHRRVIDRLRRGVTTRAWTEDAIPFSALALSRAPALLKLAPDAAAQAVVQAWREHGHMLPLGPQESPMINQAAKKLAGGRFKRKLVAAIERLAAKKCAAAGATQGPEWTPAR